MLQFFPMLASKLMGQAEQQLVGQATNTPQGFRQALGAGQMGQRASTGKESVGMQYANAGLQAPPVDVPNIMQMVNGMGGQQAQMQQNGLRPKQEVVNQLLQMLMGGGK